MLFVLERVMGIEPTQSAWKAEILPLNYTRLCKSDFISITSFTGFVNPFFAKSSLFPIFFEFECNPLSSVGRALDL